MKKLYRIVKREQEGKSKPVWDIETSLDGVTWEWSARYNLKRDAIAYQKAAIARLERVETYQSTGQTNEELAKKFW